MGFTFLEADTEELLKKAYRFRYKIWCEEADILDCNNYPDKLETDKYDEFSDHFMALNEKGEVCGNVRFIHHSPIGYPTENYLSFDKEKYAFESNKLAELSRIFVDEKYRTMKDTKAIFHGLLEHFVYWRIKEYHVEYCYGGLEEKFLKLLNIFKLPYSTLSESGKICYGGFRYPCIMYTKDIETKNPELFKLYREKYVSDQ